MRKSPWLWMWLALPGAATALAAVGLAWGIVRAGGGEAGGGDVARLVGWLAALMWMATVAGIAVGALAPSEEEVAAEEIGRMEEGEEGPRGTRGWVRWRLRLGRDHSPAWLGYCLLIDGCGAALVIGKWAGLGGGGAGGWLGWREVGAVYVLIATWTGVWTMAAVVLRRWGAGLGMAVPLGLAMVCMSGPMTAMPVVREGAGSADGRSRVVSVVMGVCPLTGMLNALGAGGSAGGGRLIEWGSFPLMYAYSGLGQSVPAKLPVWWESAGLYGCGAAAAWGLSRWRRQVGEDGR